MGKIKEKEIILSLLEEIKANPSNYRITKINGGAVRRIYVAIRKELESMELYDVNEIYYIIIKNGYIIVSTTDYKLIEYEKIKNSSILM